MGGEGGAIRWALPAIVPGWTGAGLAVGTAAGAVVGTAAGAAVGLAQPASSQKAIARLGKRWRSFLVVMRVVLSFSD